MESVITARQIEAFRAVMVYGGSQRAAEALNISQPAVSRLVSSLEQEIGFLLFDREGRGLVPTPEAQFFLRDVDGFFNGLDRLDASANAIREGRQGTLRLSVMPAVALSLAQLIIEGIVTTFPKAQVTLDVHTAPRIADLVAAGRFDIGLAHLDEARADLEVLSSWTVDCVCVMRADHPLSTKPQIEAHDFADNEAVLLSFDTRTARQVEQMFLAADVRPKIRVTAQPSYVAFRLAEHGLGITIIDAFTASTLASPKVAIRPLAERIGFRVKMIRPSGLRPSALASQSADIARRVLDEQIPLIHSIVS